MNLDCLPKVTADLFTKLTRHHQHLNGMLMIGGTALAMHIQHRISEDLDFTTGEMRLPVKQLKQLIKSLEMEGCSIDDVTDLAAQQDFENDGLDIANYQQDWLVDGVKLTFFTFGDNEHENETIFNAQPISLSGIQIADLNTLTKTKSHVLTKRLKSRDLFDIYTLIKSKYTTLKEVLVEMEKSSGHLNFDTCLNRLLEKPIQTTDEGLISVGVNLTVEEIRDFLKREAENLEHHLANLAKVG